MRFEGQIVQDRRRYAFITIFRTCVCMLRAGRFVRGFQIVLVQQNKYGSCDRTGIRDHAPTCPFVHKHLQVPQISEAWHGYWRPQTKLLKVLHSCSPTETLQHCRKRGVGTELHGALDDLHACDIDVGYPIRGCSLQAFIRQQM